MTHQWLHTLRLRLADERAHLHYALLGVAAGAVTALIVSLFRWLLEGPGQLWMPGGDPEAFEQLEPLQRLLLPMGGALVLGLILTLLRDEQRGVGVAHVIKRLHSHSGQMPFSNLMVQLFGGAWVLICGLSGGREGPAIHIGAATNSLLGQRLGLPNNSLRTLVGCGTAAAIAASFDTPIAGVIFAMEVVMMDYTIAGFMPVMLATVTATTISRLLFGESSVMGMQGLAMNSLWELPYVVLLGVAAGACSAGFVVVMRRAMRWQHHHVILRLLAAGTVTGVLALGVPHIMGIGYDTLEQALHGELPLLLLGLILTAKLIATAIGCGLGVPTGLIGANLLIGACLGSALGMLGQTLMPNLAAEPGFYAMLGMGATMGAVLNAPLAALTALLEFTGNVDMIFPGMLAIVIANLTHGGLFKQASAHQAVLASVATQGLRTDPVSLALSRNSVAGVMDRNIALLEEALTSEDIDKLLARPPNWLVIQKSDDSHWLLHRDHALPLLQAHSGAEPLTLLAVSDRAIAAAELPMFATLREALDLMDAEDINAVFIATYLFDSPYPDAGVLTRSDIERYYRSPR